MVRFSLVQHKDIDWAKIRDKLNMDWTTAFSDSTAEEMLSTFIKTCE